LGLPSDDESVIAEAFISIVNIAIRYMADDLLRYFFGGFVRLHVLYHAAKESIWGETPRVVLVISK
jgi:hypothetical protein